ncbi:MAG: hypothetical protein IKG56_00820 [Clostridia bacterium]|nr:hypothetical protein [Clostridia bacterium]
MKKESGLGIVLMIIIVCAIVAVAVGLFYWYRNLKNDVKDSSVKSDMLLIEGAGKVSYESNVMNKTTDKLIGTKISEVEKNENIDKYIIEAFKATNTIDEGDYDKYYILTNDDLKELKLEVTNKEGSYYIIGYEKDDVIITEGYEGKYRLSEINKEDNKEPSEESNNEDNAETSEEKTEQSSEDKEGAGNEK